MPSETRSLARWWVYQRERFPVIAHGILIAAFSCSAVCFSALLRGATFWPGAQPLVVAFVTAFLFFLQLRIADEFKDHDEDTRYRPYRPVPRGLVSLRELAGLGVLAALLQLGLALWLSPSLVLLLGVVWLYLVLMSQEFYVGSWLRTRHVAYMLSHMAIVPLIDLYATACDWWPTGSVPEGLFAFVAVSYFNGVVIEVGRKVRRPADEEVGVATYSSLWGPRGAVAVWFAALLVTAGCALAAAHLIGFVLPVAACLVVLLTWAVVGAWRYLGGAAGKEIEKVSGVWTVGMYLFLGVVPLAWRLLTS